MLDRRLDVPSVEVMELNEERLIITPSPRTGRGGQQVTTSDPSVKVEMVDGSMSITCGIHRSQLKNKRLAIALIELALSE